MIRNRLKNNIYVNDKQLLCDDYILICKDKGSNKLEVLGNVNPEDMALMIYPLVELVGNELALD